MGAAVEIHSSRNWYTADRKESNKKNNSVTSNIRNATEETGRLY